MFPLDSFRQEDMEQTHSVQSSRVDIGTPRQYAGIDRKNAAGLKLDFLRESTEGDSLMWIRRSWLKWPVGKGNENDIAPRLKRALEQFRVV